MIPRTISRLAALAFVGAVAAAAPMAVLAQDGPADRAGAVERFLTEADRFGAASATVGEVVEEGDAVVVRDLTIAWNTSVSMMDETIDLTGLIAVPDLTVEGLGEDAGGITTELLAAPKITVDLKTAVPPDAETFQMRMDIAGWRIENARWDPLPRVEQDPARPLSRFAPLVDWLGSQTFALNTAQDIVMEIMTPTGRDEVRYGDVVFGPMNEGRLESYSFGPIVARQEFFGTFPDETLDPYQLLVRYGASSGEVLDFGAVAAFLTETRSEAERRTLLEAARIGETSGDAGALFQFSLGESAIRGGTIELEANDASVLVRADAIALAMDADLEPEDGKDMFEFLLDIYGAFAIEGYDMSDISVTAEGGSFSLDTLAVEDLSAAGLGALTMADFNLVMPDTAVELDAFALTDLAFPEREALLAAMGEPGSDAPPAPRQIMDAMATLGGVSVDGLKVSEPGATPLVVDAARLTLADYVHPIPTRIALSLEGLELPARMVKDERAGMVLGMLGTDPLKGSAKVDLAWDEASERLTASNDISMEGIGRLALEAALSGIPRSVIEDPSSAQALLATAALDTVEARFEDDGLTPSVLDMMSQQSGIPREEFAASLADQIAFQITMMVGDEAFASRIGEALRTYLADPQSMSVTLNPEVPIAFAQLAGAAMTAPQALPGLLNLSISANR